MQPLLPPASDPNPPHLHTHSPTFLSSHTHTHTLLHQVCTHHTHAITEWPEYVKRRWRRPPLSVPLPRPEHRKASWWNRKPGTHQLWQHLTHTHTHKVMLIYIIYIDLYMYKCLHQFISLYDRNRQGICMVAQITWSIHEGCQTYLNQPGCRSGTCGLNAWQSA